MLLAASAVGVTVAAGAVGAIVTIIIFHIYAEEEDTFLPGVWLPTK